MLQIFVHSKSAAHTLQDRATFLPLPSLTMQSQPVTFPRHVSKNAGNCIRSLEVSSYMPETFFFLLFFLFSVIPAPGFVVAVGQ